MEIWKPLRNFPSYNGSSEGRIINVRTQHILKPQINDRGYAVVTLWKNKKAYTVRVHRIIAETFLGEHSDLDVRHKNRNRSDNRVDNLEWVTRSELIQDAFVRGTKTLSRHTAVRVIETGKVYENVTACAIDTGCDRSQIFKQLAGSRLHVKGLHFERISVSI
jgi:hypothetical protein